MFLLFRLVDMTYLMRENPNARDIPETLVCLELQNSVIRGRELSGARLAPRHSSKVSVAALAIKGNGEPLDARTRSIRRRRQARTTLTAAAVNSETRVRAHAPKRICWQRCEVRLVCRPTSVCLLQQKAEPAVPQHERFDDNAGEDSKLARFSNALKNLTHIQKLARARLFPARHGHRGPGPGPR